MDSGERINPQEDDTYIDLNHPPMKIGRYEKSETETSGPLSKTRSEPVVTLSASDRSKNDVGGGFDFHLGGLSRG